MAEMFAATPDVPIAVLPTSEEYAAVQQILASKHFAKAPLLSSFLMYASRRALEEEAVRISEYEIGVNVFERDTDFDPRQDNIVRTYARHLRKRLQDYYEADGKQDMVRVEIPKGTYVPAFRTCLPEPAETEALDMAAASDEAEVQTELPARRFRWKYSWLICAAVVLLAAYSTALFKIAQWRVHPLAVTQNSPLHPLWVQLFRTDRDTFVIPGDIGFVILQQSNHRTFSLAEYLNWFSSENPDNHLAMSYLKDQTYTSVLNLEIVSNLQRLPEAIADRFIIRAAKNVRPDDLSDGNAILLGSSYSNPWDEIFSSRLNIRSSSVHAKPK
jgi:hypothetical protein